MKKLDIIISLITGEGVGLLFLWFIKNSTINIPFLNIIFIVFFPIFSLFCLWISYLLGKKYVFIFQLAKFLLVGALFALFDLAILNTLMVWFKVSEGMEYSIFVTISFIIATTVKYVADKYWVFEKKEGSKVHTEFSGFFIVTLISAGIQIGIASFIVNVIGSKFGITPLVWANIGKIAGITIASAWNFVGYKFLVFKK